MSCNRFKPDTNLIISIGFILAAAFILFGCVEAGGGPVNNEELYKLLGVSKKSTTKEIRVAFKKLALEKHPDKNTVPIYISISNPCDFSIFIVVLF